jgi:hypothetical protein
VKTAARSGKRHLRDAKGASARGSRTLPPQSL